MSTQSNIFFEDLEQGDSFSFGSQTVTKAEIIQFARQFDPQPFHISETAARESVFNGLIASGWHTASLCVRMVVDDVMNSVASMGGRGVDELRWPTPVRPGDTLQGELVIGPKRRSETHANRGYIDFEVRMWNQDHEDVFEMVNHGMVQRR